MSLNRYLFPILLFVLLLSSEFAFGQKSKDQLEREKKENLKRIVETQKILLETETEKKATVGQLTAINRQIQARESLIGSIKQEINLLDGEISDLTIVVNALQSDLKTLKEEYAAMIFAAYKSNWGMQRLTFIFSAKTFNQLVRRMAYLEQYTEARQVQVKQIVAVSKALADQRANVQVKRTEQGKLLNEELRQAKNLIDLKTRQSELITALSDKEKELRQEMASRKKAIEQMDKLIADLISKELNSKKTKEETKASVVADTKSNSSFESSKAKLIWPVETGFISSKFGEQPHPVLKGIMVNNQGVDIQTNSNALVKSVFTGKVATVAFVPGMNSVIILQHGDYYTVYSRLKKVNVKKGQEITTGEVIGEVYTDNQGVTEVQFQVWKSSTKLDPEKWLSSK
jgi:septal ring factor EnvC (AmiA/AmiB activator)